MAGNYFARLHKVTKSWAATVLAIRINDRIKYTKVFRDGKAFLAYTASEWMDDMDTTAKEHRNAMECLREHGLIETQRHIWNNRNVLHIRLTPFAQALVDKEDDCPEGQVHNSPNGDASQTAPEGTFIKEEEYKYGVLNKEFTSEQPLASANFLFEKESGKGEVMKKPVGSVLDVVANQKGSNLLHKPDSLMKMGDLWVKLVGEESGKFVSPLTSIDRKKLNDFAKKCPGKDGAAVLRRVLGDWVGFVKRVETDAGVKSTPFKPNIDFLLKHVGIAVGFATPSKKVPEKQHEAVTHGTVSPPVQLIAKPKASHTPATLAEINAILDGTNHEQD